MQRSGLLTAQQRGSIFYNVRCAHHKGFDLSGGPFTLYPLCAIKVDLNGMEMPRANFDGVDLSHAYLRNSDLQDSTFGTVRQSIKYYV